MKVHIHETVQRLMELEVLVARLRDLRRNYETTASVEALIESLCSSLPLPVLLDHRRWSAEGRQSVAEVRGQCCSACGDLLPRMELAALRRGALKRCAQCGRYFYLVEADQLRPV